LEALVRGLAPHDFVDPPTLERVRQRPTWFLYSLVCYDLWHKLFIERSLARPERPTLPRREAAPLVRAS
jgi:hypothetical protein